MRFTVSRRKLRNHLQNVLNRLHLSKPNSSLSTIVKAHEVCSLFYFIFIFFNFLNHTKNITHLVTYLHDLAADTRLENLSSDAVTSLESPDESIETNGRELNL